MEVQILYTNNYKVPLNISHDQLNEACLDANIEVEPTNTTRIFRFTGSNEHNIRVLAFKLLLKAVKNDIE